VDGYKPVSTLWNPEHEHVGKWVRTPKAKGKQFIVMAVHKERDEVSVYGGDKNQNGHQSFRTFFLSDLVFLPTKKVARKLEDA
jgi:hypothetical protein